MKKTLTFIGLQVIALIAILNISGSAQRPDRLSSQQWRPTVLNGRSVNLPQSYFEINMNRNRFTASTGCNNISGGVRVTGRNLRLTNVASTRKMCGAAAMKVENELIRALDRTTRYTQTGNRLFFYAKNRVVIEFRAIDRRPGEDSEPQKFGLEDRRWILSEIRGRRIGKVETSPFLSFDMAKRSAGGDSGCNVFGGSYSVNGSRIRIFDVISTMRACIEDNRMEIERGFLEGLRQADRYELGNDRLRLYRGQTLLLSFEGTRK